MMNGFCKMVYCQKALRFISNLNLQETWTVPWLGAKLFIVDRVGILNGHKARVDILNKPSWTSIEWPWELNVDSAITWLLVMILKSSILKAQKYLRWFWLTPPTELLSDGKQYISFIWKFLCPNSFKTDVKNERLTDKTFQS